MMRKQVKRGSAALMALAAMGLTCVAWAKPDWSYEGEQRPANWAELNPDYALCRDGLAQSPVDLAGATDIGRVLVGLDYRTAPLTLRRANHALELVPANGGRIFLGHESYPLKFIRFHTPSEHTYNGERFPLEMQFFHEDLHQRRVVLSVFYIVGSESLPLARLAPHLPDTFASEKRMPLPHNIRTLIPFEPQMFRYNGSDTVPPCAEGVQWLIAQQPMTLEAGQLAQFQMLMGNNARPVQPLGQRMLITPNMNP
ncbi:carbonic anhydrase family protein [Magnetofaba australis]|uniref:carbonic anhydrase n=1 Tax=Magnetofaba australis IT-1 TaxID=1434232 RepID=A0A1Y2KAJ3_9PROT|nr:carbonic anhydrase family protein [Magnetofaba australis]OSM06944.1 putative carbonate dehydratase [Magnetofaba australis IT-1]